MSSSNLEYVCERKLCKDRTPKEKGLCSLKEDFTSESSEPVNCYYLKTESFERCVEKDKCPSGFEGVRYFFFFEIIILYYKYREIMKLGA
jgi:hypothetical protein